MSARIVWLLLAPLAVAACSDAQPTASNPFAPTSPIAAAPAPAREGMPLEVGQTVTGSINPNDPSCGNEQGLDSPEPCRLFVVTVPERGILTVRATTPGAPPLSLRVNQERRWGQALEISVAAQVGLRYEVGVALHDGPHPASQGFELSTSLEPH
jgi:hypothetical protein